MNTQVETETAKRRVAEHYLLDAAGAVVEEFERAHAIRYVDLDSGQTVDYMPSGDAMRMLAMFGARTLATNEASQVRNAKDSGGGTEQVEAIKARFSLIDSGTWVDRTREGGPRYDLPTLAKAVANVYLGMGKINAEQAVKVEANALAAMQGPDGKSRISTYRQIDGVDAEYKRLRGAKVVSADDVLSTLV